MQKKDDKVGNKMLLKEGKEKKKGATEKKIEINLQNEVPRLAYAHARKTKKLFSFIRLLQNSFFAIFMLIRGKPVQRRRIGEKMRPFRCSFIWIVC